MKEIIIAMEIYLLAAVISLAVAFMIQGILWVARKAGRKKEPIQITKESEV